jgi:MFS family permease
MTSDSAQATFAPSLSLGEKLIILLSGVLAALALTALTPVLPLIEASLARTPLDSMLVKQLIGGVALAMVVGAAAGGLLTDWLGLRRMLLVASSTYVLAGTAGLYLESLRALLVSRLFLGLAAATIQIASLTLINTRLHGNERAKWMGIHFSTAMFGTILLSPVAGALGSLGWRWPCVLYALGLIFIPATLLQRKPQTTTISAATPDSAATPITPAVAKAASGASSDDALGGEWRHWFPFHYLLLALLIGALVFLPGVYLPFVLREVKGSTPWMISLVITADSIVGAVMAMMYGRARRSLTSTAAFVFCFGCIALGSLIASRASSLAGIVAGMCIHGLGVGWVLANLITSLATKVSAERQGRAVGIVKAAHFASAPLGIAIIEPFARRHGPAGALVVVSACAFGLFALYAFLQLTTRQRLPLPQ